MPNKCLRHHLRRKPMPPHRWPRHKLMPKNARPVALLVARPPLPLPVGQPLLLPVGSSIPLAPVRRPMTSRGPLQETSRMNGMPPPARTDAATCASRTPTPCAVMDTNRRVRPPKDERRSPLTLSPARPAGLFLCETNPRARSCTAAEERKPSFRTVCLAPLRRGLLFFGSNSRPSESR